MFHKSTSSSEVMILKIQIKVKQSQKECVNTRQSLLISIKEQLRLFFKTKRILQFIFFVLLKEINASPHHRSFDNQNLLVYHLLFGSFTDQETQHYYLGDYFHFCFLLIILQNQRKLSKRQALSMSQHSSKQSLCCLKDG